jgi:uncharacterized protein (DUF849 family)
MMPLEISAVSLREMKAALEHAHETEQEVVVAVFHSFSTVKPKDVFYSDFRPDRVVLWRLEKLARYLAEHSDRFQVTTMGEMAKAGMRESGPPAGLAHVGWVAPVLRKAVQAVNRIYWT